MTVQNDITVRDDPTVRDLGQCPGGLLTRLARCRFALSRKGSAAVEFAFGMPIFLALVYTMFEFARVFWTQNTLEYAIEEAARFAMVNGTATASEVETVATDSAIGLAAADLDIDVTFEQDNSGSGTGPVAFVNITGTYTFSPVVPIVIPFIGTGSTIDFTTLQFDIVTTTRMAVVL